MQVLPGLSVITLRLVFSGLCGLGAYMTWRAYQAGIDQFVDVTRPAEGIIEELSRLRRERGLPEQLRVYLSRQRGHNWWGTCQPMPLFP